MSSAEGLVAATSRLAAARREVGYAEQAWRQQVREALEVMSATEVAAAAGVTRQRVYQIRDGRR